MDTRLKPVGQRAYQELREAYTARWAPVYEGGLAQFGVRFRPDVTPASLSRMIFAHVTGFALGMVGHAEFSTSDARLFARSVQALIYAAIDPGDGESVGLAIDRRLS